MEQVIVDIGEFNSDPRRTGACRTVCELLRHWPQDVPVQFARYDSYSDGLVTVSGRAIAFLIKMFGRNTLAPRQIGEEARLIDTGLHSARIDLQPGDSVLVPEPFLGAGRVAFYQRAIERTSFRPLLLIHDLGPWLRPELHGVGGNMPRFLPYLRLVMAANTRAYVSAAVRDIFDSRILRGSSDAAGPVIAPGADGLGLEPQRYGADRHNIVCLGPLGAGTVQAVFEAFRSLPPDPAGGRLQFLGEMPASLPPHLVQIVDDRDADLTVIADPSDDQVRDHLRQARASVVLGPDDGLGLPALETLSCGMPTVVGVDLACLSDLPDEGQIRLAAIDVPSVAAAFVRLRDGAQARALWDAAAGLALPRWRDFAATLARWAAAH